MKKNQPVLVGSFGSPRGLKGDISINIFMSNLKSFKMLKEFFLEENKTTLHFTYFKKIGSKYIASLDKCCDRNTALSFKGKNIYSYRKNFPKLKKNEFYSTDLIGCKVTNTKNKILGSVIDLKNFGAGDLLEVHDKKKKLRTREGKVIDGRTKSYREHRKKLEAARLRRLESKKKSTYVESVVSKMEEFSTDEKI